MPSLEMGFPVSIRPLVTPLLDGIHLFWCPNVQVNGLDTTDMCTHAAMNTGASNAQEASNVPRSPSRIVSFAISTVLIFR